LKILAALGRQPFAVATSLDRLSLESFRGELVERRHLAGSLHDRRRQRLPNAAAHVGEDVL
jgi:hypothetical protein